MDLGVLLGSSLIAAVCGGLVTGYWSRRAAKKVPKTERRASAYEEVAVRLVSECLDAGARTPLLLDDRPFRDAVARVFLFRESSVVSALSSFLKHRSVNRDEAVDGVTPGTPLD